MRSLPLRLASLAALMATLPACGGANLGALGDILGGVAGGGAGAQQGQLLAEVQSVDAGQQRIVVRTEQGQTGSVRFDQNTVVVYRQQQYPVTALERGDIARMQVQQTTDNQIYASRIDVEQSVQERTGQVGGQGQLQQLAGRVGQVDHDRGTFQLQMQNGTIIVGLPYNPARETNDRFLRLRSGDSVRVEGVFSETGRLELTRFL
jgi:hypothetical protein